MPHVAVAWPWHEIDRAAMRRWVGRLPAIVPGSRSTPCTSCGLLLAEGPRTAAARAADATIPLFCFRCAHERGLTESAVVQSLGNPDSDWEKPPV